MNQKIINALLYTYAFTLVFENYDGLSLGGNSIPKAISLVLGFLLFFNSNRFLVPTERKFILPVFLYFISATFSLLINDGGGSVWFWRFNTIFFILLNFILIFLYTRRKPKVIGNMFYSFNIGIVFTTVLYIFGFGVGLEDGRLVIFGENANTIGIYSVISTLYIINTILPSKEHKYKSVFVLAIFPLINMIAQTGSRTTFVGLILALGLMLILKRSNIKSRIQYLLLSIPIMALVINYLLSFEILKQRIDASIEDGDLAGRDLIWEKIIPEVMDQPLFGLGVNGYTRVISNYYGVYFSPHNVFLEILAYGGVVGFLMFFLFYFRMIYAANQIRINKNDVFPLIVLILILQVFVSGQGLTNKTYWMLYTFIIVRYLEIMKPKEAKSVSLTGIKSNETHYSKI